MTRPPSCVLHLELAPERGGLDCPDDLADGPPEEHETDTGGNRTRQNVDDSGLSDNVRHGGHNGLKRGKSDCGSASSRKTSFPLKVNLRPGKSGSGNRSRTCGSA